MDIFAHLDRVIAQRRTAAYCDDLKAAGHEALIRERTGLLIDPYFSGTKLRWLLDNVDGARARAEAGEATPGDDAIMALVVELAEDELQTLRASRTGWPRTPP